VSRPVDGSSSVKEMSSQPGNNRTVWRRGFLAAAALSAAVRARGAEAARCMAAGQA